MINSEEKVVVSRLEVYLPFLTRREVSLLKELHQHSNKILFNQKDFDARLK
jgi:hypothetical protein